MPAKTPSLSSKPPRRIQILARELDTGKTKSTTLHGDATAVQVIDEIRGHFDGDTKAAPKSSAPATP